MIEQDMIDVKSSMIKSIGYEDGRLYVQFKNNLVYSYDEVPEEYFEDLLDAESIGGFFHRNIKDEFSCSRTDFE
jgi:hypothetical protein